MSTSTGEPVYRSEEWLRERYWGDGMTMGEIADRAGCSHSTVKNWVHRHGIETRWGPASDADLVHAVVSVARELGRRPSTTEYAIMSDYTHEPVVSRFGDGSWPAAMDELLGPLGY
jgi:transposase-like protein